MPIRGVIFDLDGTIVTPTLDFAAIRQDLGLPPRTPILEALDRMSAQEQVGARDILRRHELAGAQATLLMPGVGELLAWLEEQGIRRALLSRNSRESVDVILSRWQLSFDPVLTREDAPYKPDPRGIWKICEAWQISRDEIVMIGDYLYDVQAARNAGVRAALITHGQPCSFEHDAEFVFTQFAELREVIIKS